PAADIDKLWFYPGDVGSLGPDRVLCIHGRADEVINRGGVKLAPNALDEALRSRPGVRDAAVCAAAGPGAGELWIAIVADAGFSMSALRQFVAKTEQFRLGSRSGSELIFLVKDIPRTEMGKIKRRELRERLGALRDRYRLAE